MIAARVAVLVSLLVAAALLAMTSAGDGLARTGSFGHGFTLSKGWSHGWPWGHKHGHGHGYKALSYDHGHHLPPIGGYWGHGGHGGFGGHGGYRQFGGPLPYGGHGWGNGGW